MDYAFNDRDLRVKKIHPSRIRLLTRRVSGSCTAIFVPRSLTSMRKSTGSLPIMNA
jgi:hypothetical protein